MEGKRNLLLETIEISGYNLTPKTNTASNPTAQVPPMVLQS
jgi:hypothetical protein